MATGTSVLVTLAAFKSQARGIKYYDLPTSTSLWLSVGSFEYSGCVSLVADTGKLGHLAREAATSLAPLLRKGFQATGE